MNNPEKLEINVREYRRVIKNRQSRETTTTKLEVEKTPG
jgi:hypothetical protein